MRMWLAIVAALWLVACAAPPAGEGAQPVVVVEWHGGLCADGGECRNAMVIRDDGSIVDPAQPMIPAQADPGLFARLRAAIAATDLRAMQARPFTGICPTAFDGQEAVFTFRVPGGELQLASCASDLDPEHELFRAIREVLRAAEGPST